MRSFEEYRDFVKTDLRANGHDPELTSIELDRVSYFLKMGVNIEMCQNSIVGLRHNTKRIPDRLEKFYVDHGVFCEKAFPTITDFVPVLKHLKEEADEAISSGEAEEFADVLMLLLSAFRLRFPDEGVHSLLYAAEQKLKVCKERKWVIVEDGYGQHIKN